MDFAAVKDIVGMLADLLTPIALILSILALQQTTQATAKERVHRLTDRLFEGDKFIVEHPEIAEYFCKHATDSIAWCHTAERNEMYYKVKSAIYYHLNFFDEIFCVLGNNKNEQHAVEFENWKKYILHKMSHPLFYSVFQEAHEIWGEQFKTFVRENRTALETDKNHDVW